MGGRRRYWGLSARWTVDSHWSLTPVVAAVSARDLVTTERWTRLVARNLDDGSTRWDVPLRTMGLFPLIHDDGVLVVADRLLRCFGLADGEPRWGSEIGPHPGRPRIENGAVLVPTSRSGPSAASVTLDPATGAPRPGPRPGRLRGRSDARGPSAAVADDPLTCEVADDVVRRAVTTARGSLVGSREGVVVHLDRHGELMGRVHLGPARLQGLIAVPAADSTAPAAVGLTHSGGVAVDLDVSQEDGAQPVRSLVEHPDRDR